MNILRWCPFALALLACGPLLLSAEAKDDKPTLPERVDGHLYGTEIDGAAKLLKGKAGTARLARDIARVARKHAERWADAGETPETSEEVFETIGEYIAASVAKYDDNPDSRSAAAHWLVASKLEEVARGHVEDLEPTLSKAAKAFAAVGELKTSKQVFYLCEAARTLRTASRFVPLPLALINEASAYLEKARGIDPDSSTMLGELGHNIASRANLLVKEGKKTDAKKVIEEGLALLATEEGRKPKKRKAGAYNALVDLATEHKLIKKLTYTMRETSAGVFNYAYPYGTGWGPLRGFGLLISGDTVLNIERPMPGRQSMAISINSFDWNITYMDGSNPNGAGGSNIRAVLKMIKEKWQARLGAAKAKSASKSALPRWVKKAAGFVVTGTEDGKPTTTWCWTFKSVRDRQLTYALLVSVVGQTPKNIPPQVEAILDSLEETKSK